MPSPEPFQIFTRKLNELGLRYMVSGSVAAIYYGEPRLTNDVDIIVFLPRQQIAAFEAAFPMERFYCPPREVLQIEAAREQRGHFNILHHDSGFKADIYLGGRDALHQWGIEHAREVEIDGERVRLAPPEYVIIRKLQFYREGGSAKHLRDIGGMLLSLGDSLHRQKVRDFVAEHRLETEWNLTLERLNEQ
jgi:hypothetical protein